MIPTLETVDIATEEILERIEKKDSIPPRIAIVGHVGAGKSLAMGRLSRLLLERSWVPVRAVAPDPDLDASIHLALQLAGDLRSASVNGTLDPLLAMETSWDDRCGAIRAAVDSVERSVILVDLPPSWSRPGKMASDPFTTRRWCAELLDLLLESERPFVLAVERRSVVAELFRAPAMVSLVDLPARSEGRALLRQEGAWGKLASTAGSVADVLGAAAASKSPLELRILVALHALGVGSEQIREVSAKGIQAIVEMLRRQAERDQGFGRAWALSALPRFPVEPRALETLLADVTVVGDLAYRILRDALLIPDVDEGGLTLHPILRSRAPLHLISDLEGAHARLAAILSGEPMDLTSRASALHRLETAHHAAMSRDAELVFRVAADEWQVCVLAREISLAGNFEGALEIYASLLERFPHNTYAREYVAFHLDRLGRDPETARRNFRQAADEAPSHPWWARRLVEALVRRGLIAEAMQEWRQRSGPLLDDPEDEDRSTYLARNYHLGVARALLSRGAVREVREVLEAVPEPIREGDDELRSLFNDLLLMEEADRIGGSIFPRSVRFESRWTRPHLREEIADRKAFLAWYPGRIDEIGDDELLLLLGHRANGEVELFHSRLTLQEFQEAARVKATQDVEEGQFLEVYILEDGTKEGRTEIALHPRPQRGDVKLLPGSLALPLDDFEK